MALPHHDAAHRDEARRADAELLGAEHRGDHHVAAGLDAAVGAQLHAMPQAIEHQHLMRFGKPHLPRQPGVLDRALRAGARAAHVARDQDSVGLGLGDAGRDGADAAPCDEFDANGRVRIDLLEVVDELGQVLDRVDVVMRRRADEHHPWRRMTQPADQRRHLDPGKLAAFARLRPLRDLDLDFAAVVEVLGRHAEPSRSDLLDRR